MQLNRFSQSIALVALFLPTLAALLLLRPAVGQARGAPAVELAYTLPPAVTPPTPTPVPWDDVRVNDLDDQSVALSTQPLAVSGQNVYVVYYYADLGIYFSRSTDGGRSFLPSVVLAPNANPAYFSPAIALGQGGNLYVPYASTSCQILLTHSPDGGQSWDSPPLVIYDGSADCAGRNVSKPKVKAPRERPGPLYVTWRRWTEDPWGPPLFLSRSTDGGQSWSPARQITVPFISTSPGDYQLVARGNRLDLVIMGFFFPSYREYKVMFSRSTDGGESWSPLARVDDGMDGSNKASLDMVVDSQGTLYVAWSEERPRGLVATYVTRSTDGGETWSPGVRVDDASCEQFSSMGALAYDRQTASLYVTLHDSRRSCGTCPMCSDALFTLSNDGGMSWKPNEQISNPDESYLLWDLPIVEAQGGVAYTVWTGGSPSRVWLDVHDTHLPPRTLPPLPTGAPTATPTSTGTSAPSPTSTASPTPTTTPSPTGTPTLSPTPTASPAPTTPPSPPGTPTPSPASTATPTLLTPTPSPTGTASLTPTPTAGPREWRLYLPDVRR